jgi:hypothetical protein
MFDNEAEAKTESSFDAVFVIAGRQGERIISS